MYSGTYSTAEDTCSKLLGRVGETYEGKHCLGCVHCEDSDSAREMDQPSLLLQQCEMTAADWSLPPSAVEWLHGSDPCDKNNIGGDVGRHLFQRIASEIDGLKSTVYQIMCKGAQPSVAGYRVPQHQEEWQGSAPFTVAEEDCYAVVPGSSQTTSSGIEDDLRESQSISSEMYANIVSYLTMHLKMHVGLTHILNLMSLGVNVATCSLYFNSLVYFS